MNLSPRYYIEKNRNNVHLRQASSLFIWNLIGLPLTMGVNIIITRYMGAQSYGDYLYVQRVFEFTFVIVNFGLFRSLNRTILLTEDEEEKRELYGTGFILWSGISLIAVVGLYLFAVFSPNVSEKGIYTLFLFVIPFCSIYFMNHLYEQVLPANNRIDLLIKQRYYPKIGLVVCSAIIYLLFNDKGLNPIIVVWVFFLSTNLLFYLNVAIRLKPSFKNLRKRIRDVFTKNKEYGSKVYVGDLFSIAFNYLLPLLISEFSTDNSTVGFYALALMICSPMNFIPNVLTTSHYRELSKKKKIPGKLFKTTLLSSFGCLLLLWILITPFVKFFYTAEYEPVIMLTIVTSIGTFLYGFSDFISRYLTSQGDGVALRNSSFIVGFSTLALSFILIPRYNATGAAWTHVLAGLIYAIVIMCYYRRCVKRNELIQTK